jgi:osmotically inducible protein OsmC
MAISERTASTIWSGTLAAGKGEVTGDSGAFSQLPVTWGARTEQSGGLTSPEELAAAAHASCFSMALALKLGEAHVAPDRLEVAATVTLDEVGGLPTIVSSSITVRARVSGIDDARFQDVVKDAAALCPVSRLFAGARIDVKAELER